MQASASETVVSLLGQSKPSRSQSTKASLTLQTGLKLLHLTCSLTLGSRRLRALPARSFLMRSPRLLSRSIQRFLDQWAAPKSTSTLSGRGPTTTSTLLRRLNQSLSPNDQERARTKSTTASEMLDTEMALSQLELRERQESLPHLDTWRTTESQSLTPSPETLSRSQMLCVFSLCSTIQSTRSSPVLFWNRSMLPSTQLELDSRRRIEPLSSQEATSLSQKGQSTLWGKTQRNRF